MAKQAGKYRFRGSIDGLCFYKMHGEYYVRLRSSLTGKQFWKRKAFEGSRKSCKRFGEGNKLASRVYRMIDKENRGYSLFCFLKKRAILLLKEAMSIEKVEAVLIDYVFGFGLIDNHARKEQRCIISGGLKISLDAQNIIYNIGKANANMGRTIVESFERTNCLKDLRLYLTQNFPF